MDNDSLKVTMVIPSYWSRDSSIGWKEGDSVYDHPAPLDMDGTLARTLESIDVLKDKDFQLVVIAVATAEDIEKQVEEKISGIVKAASPNVKVYVIGPSHLRQIHDMFISEGQQEYCTLLNLHGYSNIRNLCIFIPHVLDSDVAVLIDDDEVFEDPYFISKAKEFIGRNVDGSIVNAVTGYVINPDGDYKVKKAFQPWMRYWDKNEKMNETFDKIIGKEPRLKKTSFALGGNMVIHRNLFSAVPFDTNVLRGEDTDFLINARMFGFGFFLDNQLAIKHLPPPKSHPVWKRLREDIYRFVYEQAKINNQKDRIGMTRVYPKDFDPYPGCFLKKDLNEKIEKSCKLLSEEYLAKGNKNDSKEALRNIDLAKLDATPKYDPFERLCLQQKHWKKLMEYTGKSEFRSCILEVIMG
jgi:hypothetical protein